MIPAILSFCLKTPSKRTVFFILFAGILSNVPLHAGILWDDMPLNSRSRISTPELYRVSAMKNGAYAVLWTERTGGDSSVVLLRRFSSAGVPAANSVTLMKLPKGVSSQACAFASDGSCAVLEKNSNDSWHARRFHADGVPIDASPVMVAYHPSPAECMGMTLDTNGGLITLFRYRHTGAGTQNSLRAYYCNRTGLVDSLTLMTDGSGYYYRSLCSFAPGAGGRVTLFFSILDRNGGDFVAVQTRVLSYGGSSLSWATDFTNIFRYNLGGFFEGDAWAIATGREDYPGSVAAIRGSGGNKLAVLDSQGSVSGTLSSIPFAGNGVSIGAGYNGAFGLAWNTGGDSAVLYIARERTWAPEQAAFISSATPVLSFDGGNQGLALWTKGDGLFLQRTGAAPLYTRRINGMDEDAIIGCSAISDSGNNRFAAWKARNTDSIFLCGWIKIKNNPTGLGRNWYSSVHTRDAAGAFRLAPPRGDTIALVYQEPQGGADTSVMLGVWKAGAKTALAMRTVSDNGARAKNSAITSSESRFAVVWEDRRAPHSDTACVYIQMFKPDGSVSGKNIRLSPGSRPRIVQAGSAQFLVTFEHITTTAAGGGIPIPITRGNVYACIADTSGKLLFGPVRLNDQNTNASEPVPSGILSSGRHLVVWKQTLADMSTLLHGCAVDGSASKKGSAFTPGPRDWSVSSFDLTTVDQATVALAWHDKTTRLVRYQKLNTSGMPLGDAVVVSNQPNGSTLPVSVCVSASGNVLLTSWIDRTPHSSTVNQLTGELVSQTGATAVRPSRGTVRPVMVSAPADIFQDRYLYSLQGKRVLNSGKGASSGVYLAVDRKNRVLRQPEIRASGRRSVFSGNGKN